MGKMIINDQTKATKKAIKKFSEKRLISDNHLDGSFIITNYRKYVNKDEVDIEFTGNLFGSISYFTGKSWLSSEILSSNNTSLIMVNKLIRDCSFEEIKRYSLYFGIELDSPSDIKKIKWN